MIETSYGNFDGDFWERICQICFKLKYKDEQYIEMIASPGDFGIEGFTKSGKVFQCYCPDRNYTTDELYKKQRDKITADLNKLKYHKEELKKRLGDTKIKEWIFITPYYSKNEIVAHCSSKTKELKKWGLPILDKNFVVLPQDIDFLVPFIGQAINSKNRKIIISPKASSGSPEVKIYKKSDGLLVDNALSKHTARLKQLKSNVTQNSIKLLTDKTIRHFLDGKQIIDSWKDLIQEDYERFNKIISQYEDEVEELCMFPTDDFNKRLEKIRKELNQKIKTNFSSIDEITVTDLTNYVIADWILRCPINFEN